MKHQSAAQQQQVDPGTIDPAMLLARGHGRAVEDSEVQRLSEAVERLYRANQALSGVREKPDPEKAAPNIVDLSPRLPRAGGALRPQRIVRSWSDAAWWPDRPPQPAPPLRAANGFECQSRDAQITETIGVSVRGLAGEDLSRVVASVAAEQRQSMQYRPVFFTDQADFSPFVSRGYNFEYMPAERQSWRPVDPAVLGRLEQTYIAKWGLARVVDRNNTRSRNREYPPLAMVARHNAEMSRSCHEDRFLWMAETLRIAVATERYDAVPGLADHLLAFYDKLTGPTQLTVARSLCRKFVAFGEIDFLRRFLFKNHSRIAGDDVLHGLFAAYCTNETEFVPAFARLPSGKLNAYYISKRTSVAGDQILPLFVGASETNAPNINFLMANYFSGLGEADLYKMFVNRGLSRHGQDQIKRLNFGSGNVLSTIEFDARAPATHQGDMVSVIMSCHTSGETLHYAAASVLNQTYRNLELLVCDDNPDVDSLAALGELRRDPRLRLFRSTSGQGTYNIRNNLIRESRGALITFQDSDDIALPMRLQNQVEHLREHDAAAVCAQWYRVGRSGQFVFSADHNVARLCVVSLLAPREVFAWAGPYRSARFGADTEYFESLRLRLGSGAVSTMPIPLLLGLSAETSLTRRAGMEATEDGYRSPARRSYAAAAARTRLISWGPEQPRSIEGDLGKFDNIVPDAGVIEVGRT